MQDSLNDDVVRPTKLSAMKEHLKSHWKKCIVWTIKTLLAILAILLGVYVLARGFLVVKSGLKSAYLVLSRGQLDYAVRTPFFPPFGEGHSFFVAEHEIAFMASESVQVYGWVTVIAIVVVVVVAAVRFTVTCVNDFRKNFRILQKIAEREAKDVLDREVFAVKAEAVAAEQRKVCRAFIHYLDISKKKMDMPAVEPGSTRVYFVFVTIGDGKLFPADDRRIHFFDIKGDLYPNAIGAPRYSNVVTKEKTLKVTMMGVEYILNTVPYSTVHATSIGT